MGRVFSYDSGKQKKLARENSSGSGNAYHKIAAKKTYWAIMPGINVEGDDRPIVKTIFKYEAWDRKTNTKIGATGTPQKGDSDYIKDVTKKIRQMVKKEEDADSPTLTPKQIKILKNIASEFGVKVEHYSNAVDMQATKEGVKLLKLPKDAAVYLFSKIDEADDLDSVFNPETGKILKIEHNGKEKMERRYEVIEFLNNKQASLISKSKLNESELASKCVDLDTLDIPYSEKEYLKLKEALKAQLKKIGDIAQFEEDADEEIVYASEDNADDLDVSTEKEDSDDFEAEEIEAPVKKPVKTEKAPTKKPGTSTKNPVGGSKKPAAKKPVEDDLDEFSETEEVVSEDFEIDSAESEDIEVSDDEFES